MDIEKTRNLYLIISVFKWFYKEIWKKNISNLLYFIFSYFCLCTYSNAQNLVSNPSFETYEHCLTREELSKIQFNIPSLKLAKVEDWTCPSQTGTADYFHACFDTTISDRKQLLHEKSLMWGMPSNNNGFQYARSGKAYAGIYVFATLFKKDGNYKEYLSGRLTSPLKKGKTYHVSFWCNLSDKSDIAIHQLGLYFSEKKVVYPDSFSINLPFKPQVINKDKRFLVDKEHWTKVEGKYTAQGGEKYILIGCFSQTNQLEMNYLHEKKSFNFNISYDSYYLIDDVCVSEEANACDELVQDSLLLPPHIELIPFTLDKLVVRGQATDKTTKKGVQTNISLISAENKETNIQSEPEGRFEVRIDSSNYHYAFFENEVYLPKAAKIWKKIVSEVDIRLTPIAKGAKSGLLHFVHYKNGKNDYQHYVEIELERLAQFLKKHQGISVCINAHGVPFEDKGKVNPQEATDQRSKEIAEKMISYGVDSKRVTYKGYGDKVRYGGYDNEIEIIEINTEKNPSWDINKLKVHEKITLQQVFFQPNSAELTDNSHQTLDELVSFLRANPLLQIAIYGHTDDGLGKATQTYLQQLSEDRAKSVKQYLIKKGIQANRLSSKGFGMSQPIATNATDDGRSKNRRTEFEIVAK
ncbi:MAG: OmpA family protein [Thermoflexibacter sp.]|nr:OmpA family protein [Thermoflexibacter sp.]